MDTGSLTIHFGQEVEWESDSRVTIDIARITDHLENDSKFGIVVRFTNETYEPVSDWSSGFFVAADSSSCGIERPTPIPTPIETVIPPEGGILTGTVGVSITVTFPAGVYSETLTIRLEAVSTPPATGGFQLLGRVFSITAEDGAGNSVTHFEQPITIVIGYEESDVAGMAEEDLVLHYWDVAEQRWLYIPGVVDTTANTLTITLDHLTEFAVLQFPHLRVYLPAIVR